MFVTKAGPNNERGGNFGLNSEELQQEPKK
jgi:hypothetical protein